MAVIEEGSLVDAFRPWEASRQKFLEDLPSEDRKAFNEWLRDDKSPAKLEAEIRKLEKKNQAVGKLKPLIDGLKSLDAIISPLAGLDAHGVVTLLWGSLKVLMGFAETAIKFFETISEFLDSIGHQLDLFREYEALFSKYGSERFNAALQRVYSSYLYFCSSARIFYTSSKWRKFVESTGFSRRKHSSNIDLAVLEVKTACTRAMAEVDLVDKQTNATANQIMIDSIQDVGSGLGSLRQELGDLHEDVSTRLANVNFSEFRGWLRVPDLDMESELKNLLRKRADLPNTCTWIFADDRVRKWASASEQGATALWIKADAGFGKSVLSSYVVAEMQKLYPTGIAYFFCKHDSDRQKSIVSVLRTWIWQLMSRKTINGQEMDSHLAILPETVLDFENRADPTIHAMERLMKKLHQQNKPTRLIVDGLDECEIPTENEKPMWETFFGLLAQLPSQWKVLIVSRPTNWYNGLLEATLGPVTDQMTITAADNADDLHDFAVHQVERYASARKWKPERSGEILQLIWDRAQGNLMWVSLLCEMLARARPQQIQSLLEKPPRGLGGLYGRALESLSHEDEGLAADVRLALKWILCSYRPIRLTEMEAVLYMSEDTLQEDVFKFIGPLISVNENTSEIRLVHASARDYLLSTEAAIFGDTSISAPQQMASIHAAILKECLDCLNDDDRQYVGVGPNQGASEERFRKLLKSDPLFEYSCNGWIQHLVQAFRCPDILEDVKPQLQEFLTSDAAVVRWLQMFHFLWNVHAPSDTARHLIGGVTYLPVGTHDWADFLNTNYPEFVNHLAWEDGRRYTRWDRFMHRRHGYSVSHPLSMYQSPRVMPALFVAAFFDYAEEVASMLASGTSVDHRGPMDGTPLHWAVTGGSCKAIQALLDAGANKEARYGKHRETPIFRGIRVPNAVPVRPGHYPAARMLHDEGVSLEHEPISNGFHVSTVLIALVEEGPDCEGAAEFARDLCARDPVVNGHYMRLGSILQTAAWHNRQLILKALLQQPKLRSRVNEQGNGTRRRAVLHDACTQDNPGIASMLLEAGADPNLWAWVNGFAPLHFAACAGGKTIDLLLDNKLAANPFMTDQLRFNGMPERLLAFEGLNTPVHVAVWSNNKLDFKKFVQKGFDIDQVDGNGDTPLTVALANNNFDIAKALLDAGADVTKIPRKLYVRLPVGERDERLMRIRSNHWAPIESHAYLFYFRCVSHKKIPVPVFDHILRLAGHTDIIQMSRKGRVEVNEHITQRLPRPYLMSPPVLGNAVAPVRRIEMHVHSRDQGYANPGIDYSLSKLVTMDRNLKMVHWQPEHKFGRNRHHWQDHREVITKKEAPGRMAKIRPGERLAIFPYANSPAFENVMDRAEIKVRQFALRSHFTATEREQIWGKHQDKKRGLNCKRRKCPRCAAKRLLKDRVPVETGPVEMDVAEMGRFVDVLGLVKKTEVAGPG